MLSGQVLTWVITAGSLAIASRYLGAGGFGVISLAATFAALGATIAGLGMTTPITRDVARKPAECEALVSTALWLSVALGLVAAVVGTFVAAVAGYARETQVAIALSCVAIPFVLASGVVLATIQGMEVMRHAAILDVVSKLANMGILVLVLVVLGGGIQDLMMAALVLAAVTFAVQMVYLRRVLHIGVRLQVTRAGAKNLISLSVPFFLISVFLVLYGSVDVVVLSKLGDDRDIGLFTAPQRLFGTMLFVPVAMMAVLFPRMSALSGDVERLVRVASVAMQATVVLGIAMTIVAVGFRDETLGHFLGDDFIEAGAVLAMLSLALTPMTMSIVASRVLFAANRQRAMVAISACAFIAKIGLSLVLIPFFIDRFDHAALGAAVGQVISEGAMAIAILAFMPRGWFTRSEAIFYAKVAAATGVAALVVFAMWDSRPLVASLLALAAYAGVATLLRLYVPSQLLELVRKSLRRGDPLGTVTPV